MTVNVLTVELHVVPRLRMCGAILPLKSVTARAGKTV